MLSTAIADVIILNLNLKHLVHANLFFTILKTQQEFLKLIMISEEGDCLQFESKLKFIKI